MKTPSHIPATKAAFFFFLTLLFLAGCATIKPSKLGNGLDADGNKLYLASFSDQQTRVAGFLAKHAELNNEIKIQYLLTCIQDSKYHFLRNGTLYDGDEAMRWLRWKRTHPQYKANPIRTPDDFIERVANGSVNSGLLYEVVLLDGHREALKNLLRNELVSLDAAQQVKHLEKFLSENKAGEEKSAPEIPTISVPLHTKPT